ncbi:MAG TPA: hemerythrin domain-containing protein [Chitinophaga sp.]|uniref:hemerythrin domain-containing protein n=1 Tax=Chitinophaga sp. TaxID=1869181 RepID=UPI002DBC0E2A|nr:hemerythrin domain-containing protein [Chitinophaga sp.]HEU4554928.1 hemerythrin domain-containing protein [Chitinophaga sp.]
MENHKPIKRSKAFVHFSKDHHFGLLLVWKIREDLSKGVSGKSINGYVQDFFSSHLEQHFAEEEKFIFSKLPKDDLLRVQAEEEHRNIRSLVKAIPQQVAGSELLASFADLLEAHIRFEERTLFNHLQAGMTPEDLETLLLDIEKNSTHKVPQMFAGK